jgi:hypothetical protein
MLWTAPGWQEETHFAPLDVLALAICDAKLKNRKRLQIRNSGSTLPRFPEAGSY